MELTGVKKFYNSPLEELIVAFVEQGRYEKLGNGFFAYVFKNSKKNEAIKFWVDDQAFEKYLTYIENNKNNPICPKIFSKTKTISSFHKRIPGFPKKIKYIRMEVLEPLNTYESYKINQFDWDAIVKKIKLGKPVSKIFNDAGIESMAITICDVLTQTNQDLEDLDISSSNIMKRGNQLVLTDPFTNLISVETMSDIHDMADDVSSEAIPVIKGRGRVFDKT